MKYRVYIPAYSQIIEAKSAEKAIEQFNDNVEVLEDNMDTDTEIKIEVIKE